MLQFKKGLASALHTTVDDRVFREAAHEYAAEEVDASGHYEALYSSRRLEQQQQQRAVVVLNKARTHDSYYAFADPAANHADNAGGGRVAYAHTTDVTLDAANGTMLVSLERQLSKIRATLIQCRRCRASTSAPWPAC